MSNQTIKNAGAEIRLELIDNWHDRWKAALALVEKLGQRDCLMIDEDGWLPARQNLLVAFVRGKAAGFICFRVQPILREGSAVMEDGRPAMEAAVDGSGVLPGFDRKSVAHVLLEAAMNRALELRCKKFHGAPDGPVGAN
jgi:hypothetical protein